MPEWLCLLYSASSGSAQDNSVAARLDCTGLDHWRGIVWDPGIVGQQCLHVCYDCLCLMALFRDAMLLVHDFHDVTILTWVICLNRRYQWTNYHFSANNDRPRSSVIWCGCSKIRMRWARRPRNGSIMPGRESVPTATNGLNVICIVMWLRITWTWHSCGGSRCLAARCGRARHRIAWIMFGGGGVHNIP